jgi:diguanylate cyclase (GGDEF)-like protein
MAIIHSQTEIASSDLELAAVMQLIGELGQELTHATAAVIEIAEGDDMVYKITCGEATPYLELRVAIDSSLSGLCVKRNEVLRCDDTQNDSRVDSEACLRIGAGSIVCVPLVHLGSAVGVLKVYATQARHFDEGDVETLELLSNMIGAHMAHASSFQIEAHDSRHDALTGLLNRRAFEERLAIETARANRYGYPLSLCILDLDGFKAVNDLLGHPAGDDILRKVAAAIDEQRRTDDTFRLGGDEFAVLMPQTMAEQAAAAAERLVAAIECVKTSGAGVGASYGVAQAGHDPAALHADADHELIAAKDRLHRRDRGIQ